MLQNLWYLRIAIGCFLLSMCSGIGMLPLSLYMTPVMRDLEISAANFSLAFTMLSLGCLLMATYSSKLLNRFSLRRLMQGSGLVFGGSYVLFSVSSSTVMLSCSGMLLGFGIMLAVNLIPPIIITRWYKNKQGVILGCVAAATGFASAIFSPLIAAAIQSFGWRTSACITGVVLFSITLCVSLFLFQERPEDVGVIAYGSTENTEIIPKAKEMDYINIKGNTTFWMILVAVMLIGISNQSVMTQVSTMIIAKNHSLEFSAWCVSVYAVAGMINNIFTGVLIDRFNFRIACIYCGISFIIACVIMLSTDTVVGMVLFSLLAGIWHTMSQMYGVLAITNSFGADAVASMNSYAQMTLAIGCMIGPMISSLLYGQNGSYTIPLICFIVFVIITMMISWNLQQKQNNNKTNMEGML